MTGGKVGEVEVGAGKVKSELDDVESESLEMNSIWSSPVNFPEIELKFDVDNIIFSSETWFDIEFVILRHTKLDSVLVKWPVKGYKSCHNL